MWDWTWSPVLVYNMHACETWGRLVLSDRSVAEAPDAGLEKLFPFSPPPAAAREALPGEMVRIRGGTFPIGPDATDPENSPAGTAAVAAFRIDRYPVTVGEFAAFLNEAGDGGHYHEDMADPDLAGIAREPGGGFAAVPGKERHPVVFVDQEGRGRSRAGPENACPPSTNGRSPPAGGEPIPGAGRSRTGCGRTSISASATGPRSAPGRAAARLRRLPGGLHCNFVG